jgi:hypothetical protein
VRLREVAGAAMTAEHIGRRMEQGGVVATVGAAERVDAKLLGWLVAATQAAPLRAGLDWPPAKGARDDQRR